MTIPFETRIGQCQWLFATQPRQKLSGAKRLREGRGQGRAADYKPWLDVQQVPSLGLSERIRGWKSNRVHHLFSQLEVNYFYALEWSESVTDIREQYPLLPLDETLDIAQACGFTHPKAPRTNQPIVTIELLNSKALPIWHKAKEIEENIAAGVVRILQVDPYASLQRPDETISALHRSRRDEAWKVIAPLVESGTRIFIPQERGSLVIATVERTGRTKRTIYRYLGANIAKLTPAAK